MEDGGRAGGEAVSSAEPNDQDQTGDQPGDQPGDQTGDQPGDQPQAADDRESAARLEGEPLEGEPPVSVLARKAAVPELKVPRKINLGEEGAPATLSRRASRRACGGPPTHV
jgi:hypothetical protein